MKAGERMQKLNDSLSTQKINILEMTESLENCAQNKRTDKEVELFRVDGAALTD